MLEVQCPIPLINIIFYWEDIFLPSLSGCCIITEISAAIAAVSLSDIMDPFSTASEIP